MPLVRSAWAWFTVTAKELHPSKIHIRGHHRSRRAQTQQEARTQPTFDRRSTWVGALKTQISERKNENLTWRKIKVKIKHSLQARQGHTNHVCKNSKLQGLTLKNGVDISIWRNSGFYAWTSLQKKKEYCQSTCLLLAVLNTTYCCISTQPYSFVYLFVFYFPFSFHAAFFPTTEKESVRRFFVPTSRADAVISESKQTNKHFET